MTDATTGSAALPPSNTELVIGLVGALGCDLPGVAQTIRAKLTDVFRYDSAVVSVSGLMQNLDWGRDLNPGTEDRRIKVNMDAGRDVNAAWHPTWKRHDALGRLSVLEIAHERERRNLARGEQELQRPLDRFAFIMRSFKRPDEISLLRAVYGERFAVFGVYAPRRRRCDALYRAITRGYPSDLETEWHDHPELKIDYLMARDEREQGEAGQNVRDTFHRADFFVEDDENVRGQQIERSLRALFGDYFLTPTRDESGMAHAVTAARRSAEPGRQVGAAITNPDGDVLAVGCNEVPRAFGGQYWAEDGEDGREFVRAPTVEGTRRDTNNTQQEAIADNLLEGLRERVSKQANAALEQLDGVQGVDGVKDVLASIATLDERATLLDGRLGDITEFGRAVHAEMAAITTAARIGIPLRDSILYTTTFPCHNCARHVIATGIRQLVYIAPYAKSQAYQLHDDALTVAPDGDVEDKVIFKPFIGVSPRRYAHLFYGHDRKLDDGTILVFDPTKAVPRLQDADPPEIALDQLAYGIRETAVANAMEEFLSEAQPTLAQSTEGGNL
jgi:cytidine deaminase